jgi:hypothetical protein
MADFIDSFYKLLPYFISFPLFVFIISFILQLIYKKNVTDRNMHLFGLFINLNNKDILSIALLLVQLFFIICSIFVNSESYYIFLFIVIPVVLFSILINNWYALISNFVLSLFTCALIIFKDVFYAYIKDVYFVWYVGLIYVVLCLSILTFSLFIFTINFGRVVKNKKLKNTNNSKIK